MNEDDIGDDDLLRLARFCNKKMSVYESNWIGVLAEALGYNEKESTHDTSNQNNDLSCWFGLSYASWLTLPRVMMEAMPKEWQQRMARLLNQYDNFFPNQPDLGTRVQVTSDRKLIKTPKWLINYRRPDLKKIQSMK